MKVFIVGGTGLLGSAAAKELVARGHEVVSLSLPPLPEGAVFPPQMKIEYGNYLELSDEDFRAYFRGCDAFVFAAGVDERVEAAPPVYELYRKYNIAPTERLLRLAKECGVKRTAICGSYFAYFAGLRPEWALDRDHPYIRSRTEQEKLALSFADENFSVAVLELPYIFGAQPGRKPVWVFLVEMLRKMKPVTFWCRGGTAMITVRQAGQAIAGALERNRGGQCYPLGYYNMTWREMLKIFHEYMGRPRKKIVTVPDWMFAVAVRFMKKRQQKRGSEGGLDLPKFVKLQCSEQFIDKALGCVPLGVEPDDIRGAIGESVRLSADILDRKTGKILEMKGN